MPSCVNPAHLRIGTYKENVADMDARGRRVTNTPKGESNCNAKMTAEMVTSLRQRYVAGEPLADLIADFGCTKTSLSDYTSGKSWAHILGKNGCPDIDALRLEQKRRRNSAAKITPEIADEIRRRLRRGETGRSIAKRFGVHFATISDIKNGKTWVD